MSFPIIQKKTIDAKTQAKIDLYTKVTEELQKILATNSLTGEEAELILVTLTNQLNKKAKQAYIIT